MMNQQPTTSFTIKELLDIFRSGLAALVPIVERAGIPWRAGEAYDDWDAIASVLYEQIVANTLRACRDLPDDLELPRYDLIYPSYDNMAHFEVVSLPDTCVYGVFVGFDASEPNFSQIKYVPVGKQADEAVLIMPFNDCGIRLRTFGTSELVLESVTLYR